MSKVWINKKLVYTDRARISIFDRGFMYGDGVFETMRSYSGTVFKIDDHLARLERSLKIVMIKPPYLKSYLRKEIYKLIDANALKDAYIRLTVTRGEGRFGIEHKEILKPNVVIIAKEFHSYPEWMYKKGISACIVDIRQNDLSRLSSIKSLNFMGNILARFEAKEKGCDEAILLNTLGFVAEAVTSNLFAVKRGALLTPSIECGILPGVTRGAILKIAKDLNIKVKEKEISRKELLASDEAFLTNSLVEVLPVTRIDKRVIGSGSPGEITKMLRSTYQKEALREVAPFAYSEKAIRETKAS